MFTFNNCIIYWCCSLDYFGLSVQSAYVPHAIVVKTPPTNVLYEDYIIGIDNTGDNTQGNGIGFNEELTYFANNSNIFFPTNTKQPGWKADIEYLANPSLLKADVTADKWYHVIMSQDSDGLVQVYVNGM